LEENSMRQVLSFGAVLLLIGTVALAGEPAHKTDVDKAAAATDAAQATPNPDEQVVALEAQCAESAEERAARHAEETLFDRMGGEERIHALTREVVRLHLENDDIKHLFVGLDPEKVAHRVALFVISGTGGPAVYDGPELTESHAHMQLTNADFMAAGSDVMQAMKNLEYGQNEIDEMVCALVGLREHVVLVKETAAVSESH
jgi:hemoglobin